MTIISKIHSSVVFSIFVALGLIVLTYSPEATAASSSILDSLPIDKLKSYELSPIEKQQLLQLSGWVVGIVLVILVVLGVTNRVVIFYNDADAFWSISPVLFMLLAAFISISLSPEGKGNKDFFDTPIQVGVMAVGFMLTIYGVYKTIANSIKYNKGVVVGLFIGVCKTIISVVMAVTLIGALRNAFSSANSHRENVMFSIIVMIVGAIWLALINGHRVYDRKGWSRVTS